MNRLVDVGTPEKTIARLRADLAVLTLTNRRLAAEIGHAVERREFFGVLAATTRAEYDELCSAIGQPVDGPGASTHASAVEHGEWLTSLVKTRLRQDDRIAGLVEEVDRLRTKDIARAGVIPSTAPVRVLDGGDDSERDEPSEDRGLPENICELIDDLHADIDRTTAGCATACTDDDDPSAFASAMVAGITEIGQQVAEERWAKMSKAERVAIVDKTFENPDPRFSADDVKLSWHDNIKADYGTPDQTDGYHGGDSELAADDVLDDPRMRGYQWIHPTKAEIDAWGERPWEWDHGETTTIIGRAIWGVICHPDTVAFRPLRFSGMGLDGIVPASEMTEDHFARVERWECLSDGSWFRRMNAPFSMSDVPFNPTGAWRPVGWPDAEAKPAEPCDNSACSRGRHEYDGPCSELSADELEANIDKSMLMPLDAGAKAVAEFDAAIEKYSPDMKRGRRELPRMHIEDQGELIYRQQRAIETLTHHVDTLDASFEEVKRRQSSLDTLVPTVTQLGARMAKLEGVGAGRQPCSECGENPGIVFGVCLVCLPLRRRGASAVVEPATPG